MTTTSNRWTSGPALVGYLAAAKLALHMATAPAYGFFIDELYFLACGERLAWGYVDMPPLTAFQAWLARALFGDSPWSIRLFPSLAGAGLVLIAGALARALGGGRYAQFLAALAVLMAPINLAMASYLSMNSIEPLVWMGCAIVVVRMIRTGETRLWVAFGVIAGVGLLNKHTMLIFGFAMVMGLLLTPERRLLASRWLVAGGLVALVIVLPNVVWMVQHDFPHLELLENIRRNGRDLDIGLLGFLQLQVLFQNPLALPVWAAGLGALLFGLGGRYRALGLAWLVTFGMLALTPGSHKAYYMAPAYAMLFAAGAVVFERVRWRGVRAGVATAIALAGIVVAPTVVPILPPDTYLRYEQALGIAQPRLENRATHAMPQFFADRMGWPEMVETVARVYHALPAEERARTAIFANDYGQGGAIDFYGPRYGLPKAIGGHLTYWLWGPGEFTGQTLIVLGDDRDDALRWFEEVEVVAQVGHPHAMMEEHFPVLVCRRPRGWKLAEAWPQLKEWH